MSLKQLRIVDESAIKTLFENVPLPMALFDKSEMLACNTLCQELMSAAQYNISVPDLYHVFRNVMVPTKKEIVLLNPQLEKHWLEVIGEPVWYNDAVVILGFITDIIKPNKSERETERVTRLHELMLEINHSLVEVEDIQRTFHLILTNALKAIENAALGSIMTTKGDHFETVSHIGFGNDIMQFKLPVEHSFLYRSTNGAMDRITNIPDLQHEDLFYPITTFAGDEVFIRSHMSAPIYVKDQFYGMINLDSLVPDAFDEKDIESMEFIRSNVQIAIANQLLFIEKSQLAMFDQLTGMYNRHYFNEHFEMLKNKALRYNEKFLFVLFDIDDLKVINDRYGHAIGDQAIIKVTFQLKKNTRKSDMIARYGGDEFVGVFFGTTPKDLSEKYDDVLDQMMSIPIMSGNRKVYPSFSYGVVEFPTDGKTLEDLIIAADIRMYANKKHKNNK